MIIFSGEMKQRLGLECGEKQILKKEKNGLP